MSSSRRLTWRHFIPAYNKSKLTNSWSSAQIGERICIYLIYRYSGPCTGIINIHILAANMTDYIMKWDDTSRAWKIGIKSAMCVILPELYARARTWGVLIHVWKQWEQRSYNFSQTVRWVSIFKGTSHWTRPNVRTWGSALLEDGSSIDIMSVNSPTDVRPASSTATWI